MFPSNLNEFLLKKYAGISLQDWLIGLGIAVGTVIVLRAIRWFIMNRLQGWARRTTARFDDTLVATLGATRSFFTLGLGIWLGSEYVEPSEQARHWVRVLVSICVILQLAIWLQTAVRSSTEVWRADGDDAEVRTTTASAISFISKLVIWSVAVIMVLATLGFEISALIAGLGVGGVAAALAVQSVLGDVFASLSIYFDRPFDIGDFIIVGSELGTVEKVGLRTTRVRGLGGELIVFSNGDLTSSRIHNYKKMQERRIVFVFGVEYSTPYAKLSKINHIAQTIIEGLSEVRFDRAHFKEYGDWSLNFEVVYYVLSRDYNVFMDKQHWINLELFQRFEEEGITFAFPTRTLHVALTEQKRPFKAALMREKPTASPGNDGSTRDAEHPAA